MFHNMLVCYGEGLSVSPLPTKPKDHLLSAVCDYHIHSNPPHTEAISFVHMVHFRTLGSGGIAPHINFGSRRRWVVMFTPQLFYPRGRAPGIHMIGGQVGPSTNSDVVQEKTFHYPCLESNSNHPAHSLVTTLDPILFCIMPYLLWLLQCRLPLIPLEM